MNRPLLFLALALGVGLGLLTHTTPGLSGEPRILWAIGVGLLTFVATYWNWHLGVRAIALFAVVATSFLFRGVLGNCLCMLTLGMVAAMAARVLWNLITRPPATSA